MAGKSFVPPPKVDARIVRFESRSTPLQPVLDDADLLEEICRTGFNQRRKMLKNAFKGFGIEVEKIEELIREAGIKDNVRPEDVTVPQWCKLAYILSTYPVFMENIRPPGSTKKVDNKIQTTDQIIRVGICAMDAKAKSKAMRAILERLENTKKFELITFGNVVLLQHPVAEWPVCDCLIGFYSQGFPLDKATQYAELNRHRMFIVNDFASQRLLLDRRLVSAVLSLHSIPIPETVIISKDGLPSLPFNEKDPGSNPHTAESVDTIIVNGKKLVKPFVEKPSCGEDHHIHIYYHSKDGGGSRRLFRKVDNKSSEAHPECSDIRTEEGASYIYEEFVTTAIGVLPNQPKPVQKDLKIYTVGEHYAHAEARKSPEVDGKVERLPDGREYRQIIRLTEQEQMIASTIVRCFRQQVCGFDVLREREGNSFVCDVNGWSFVKGNNEYYNRCGELLTEMFVKEAKKIREEYPPESVPLSDNWKLRGLVSVFRHGDRTPKQKVKLKVHHPKILALFTKADKEVKMKSDNNQRELNELNQILTEILQEPDDAQGNVPGVESHYSRKRLELVTNVLNHIYDGLKVQIKPRVVDNSVQPPVIKKAMLVCKWGGILTEQGEFQSWRLGKFYRKHVIKNDVNSYPLDYYLDPPPAISSNNERRVKRTAQLVGSGFLDKDMTHLPIVADNPLTNHILGDIDGAKETIDEMKRQLGEITHAEKMSEVKHLLRDCGVPPLEEMARSNQDKNPFFFLLNDLSNYLKCVCRRLENLLESGAEVEINHGESLPLMLQRWTRLSDYIYNHKTKQYDVTKVPDVEDYVKYDIIHNRTVIGEEILIPLCTRAKILADFIVPGEYGIRPADKIRIGYRTCQPLCETITQNIKDMMESDTAPAINFHFTSESHVHPLLNLLLYTSVVPIKKLDFFCELNYLTQVIFKVFEDTTKPAGHPDRFLIQLFYSCGAIGDALACSAEDNKILPVVPAVCINAGITFTQLNDIFFNCCDV